MVSQWKSEENDDTKGYFFQKQTAITAFPVKKEWTEKFLSLAYQLLKRECISTDEHNNYERLLVPNLKDVFRYLQHNN
jgi:hypothetical protein